RPQQFLARPPHAAHPVLRLGRGRGLIRHVQPGHDHPPARAEHDRGGLGVAPYVELGRRGGVSPPSRAAHDDEPGDLRDQRRGAAGRRRGPGPPAGRHPPPPPPPPPPLPPPQLPPPSPHLP